MIETTSMSDDMPRTPSRRDQASIGEVIEFVKTYAKQETVGPLKGAGRWLGFGAAGALSLGLGLSLLLLGSLRFIQTEWKGVSDGGRLTWVPYLIVLVVCVILLVFTMMRINKTFLNKDTSAKENRK